MDEREITEVVKAMSKLGNDMFDQGLRHKSHFSKLSELAGEFINIMPDWQERYVNGIDHQIICEVLKLKEQGVI